MNKTKITLEKDFVIANVDDRLFSSFIEHLGRAVYYGIYEPEHQEADEQGFRKDVISLVRELGVKMVRYPGGNFLSGYNWTDGIGPRENRPVRLDLAWRSIEPNQVGIDEFYDWAKKTNVEVMAAVNMGTGTPKAAGEMLEYCNFPGGTYWSDLRKKNGHSEPYGIKTWCIGNEMDGPWQICHLDAVDYGKKARETAKIMKWIDDKIELVVCGSATNLLSTFPEWDRVVLEHTYEHIDYLSLHRYYENLGNDINFLASFVDMNNFIKSVYSTVEYVKSLKRSTKSVYLSFDEWNVWYQQQQTRYDWVTAPPILEDQYSLLDALVFAGMGMTLVNNADKVKIACLAQLVNVIAPIFTKNGGPAIRQTIFYPFRDISMYGRGRVLQPVVVTPSIETCYGDAPVVYVSAVENIEGNISLFCLNIGKSPVHTIELNLRSFGKMEMIFWSVLKGKDLNVRNTFENPDQIKPILKQNIDGAFDTFKLDIEPLSWNVIRFKKSKQ
ncbi:alpha-N-arabinofuranosidase [Gracilinema caldarium]|uniref:non-reducing end alpha-L-arabinofuranosidase n=1 Tax=Gracilinema caldarium (strain ATCC 51460 / DSM 7334 / H1) TaxID=744872 RepID=F8EYS4_GRAC1|nr:alpha-N-arabinofuranosidase [Gracilinema caldarium]AEJ18870.1 Alpha-N-arabinofuranosidase [Gracilinema caldarium DSM 7334]